jgi:hypothetical protein
MKARKTFPFQVRPRNVLQSFSQTEAIFQRAHHRQMRYSLESYPAPSRNISRNCAGSGFSVLYLGTIPDFTDRSELMLLVASLSSMLKLFTSVSLFLGLSTFLFLPVYCPILSSLTETVFYGRRFLSFRLFSCHLHFPSDKQPNVPNIRCDIRHTTHSVGYNISVADCLVLGGNRKPTPQHSFSNPLV